MTLYTFMTPDKHTRTRRLSDDVTASHALLRPTASMSLSSSIHMGRQKDEHIKSGRP